MLKRKVHKCHCIAGVPKYIMTVYCCSVYNFLLFEGPFMIGKINTFSGFTNPYKICKLARGTYIMKCKFKDNETKPDSMHSVKCININITVSVTIRKSALHIQNIYRKIRRGHCTLQKCLFCLKILSK